MRRRALLRALVFVVVLAALDRSIFAVAMYLRDHRNYQGIDLLYYPKWDASLVFFGDSRIHHHFDLGVIEAATGLSAYNFGRDEISTRQAVFMLDQLLRNNHHPKVIVLQADPNSLDSAYGKFDIAPFREYLATLPADDTLVAPTDAGISWRFNRFATAWLTRSASIANRLPDLLASWDMQGKIDDAPPETSVCERTANHVLHCTYYHGSALVVRDRQWSGGAERISAPIHATETSLFERAVALARAHGAYLLLVETPRYLVDTVFPLEDKARTEDFYCGLARSEANVLYARLSHVDGIDFNPTLYYDAVHLNADGARVLSQIIAPLIADLAHGHRPEACVLR